MEKVVTVGLKRPQQTTQQFNSLLEELRRLVETADGHVVKEFFQNRPHPEPATLLGKGKLAEIGNELKKLGVKTAVFDDNLSPAQQKNIEKQLEAKVIDRPRLILDIFAKRARTREGQLQVELAQLEYLVPRLTGAWRGFSQQVGGIGTRGPGERKIEVERRYVRERIKRLKHAIEDIRRHRHNIRENRELIPLPQVSLVGYTNVGKSTLLNTLVNRSNEVYADDKLFATLDPTTRRVKLPGGRVVLFTDTVGFIQKLPPLLVAAFRATLEELSKSSLLVHVVDAGSDDFENQKKTVMEVIKELKAHEIPRVTVYNKADVLSPFQRKKLASNGGLMTSCRTLEGIGELLQKIEKTLDRNLLEVEFDLPHEKRNLIADIFRSGYVLSESHSETGSHLKIRIDKKNWPRIRHIVANGTL